MKRIALVLLTMGTALAACAPNKASVAELARPEVVFDSIPTGARVNLDGVERGTTPMVLRAGDGQANHALTIAAPGFHLETVTMSDGEIAASNGRHLLVPLRPDGFAPTSRAIAADDVAELTRAGSVLSRANRCAEALLFFDHALAIDERTAGAHKGMGICYAKMNRRQEALRAYKNYLLYAPDAPDAPKVQEMISRAEGDITVPPPKRDGSQDIE